MDRGTWEDEAACRPELNVKGVVFHYDQDGYDEKACAAICGSCPVQLRCLFTAMRYEETLKGTIRFGYWGGMTAKARGRLSLTDDRFAIYPDEFTVVEINAILEEMTDMGTVQFRHAVDGFDRDEVVELNAEKTRLYVDNGHASEVQKPAKPQKATAKKATGATKKSAPKPKDEPAEAPEPELATADD